eukprot:4122609-Amphidinium_carterae.1
MRAVVGGDSWAAATLMDCLQTSNGQCNSMVHPHAHSSADSQTLTRTTPLLSGRARCQGGSPNNGSGGFFRGNYTKWPTL